MEYNSKTKISVSGSAHIPHWHNPDSDRSVINEGEGPYVFDENGKTYLDFVSSLYCVNAGHDNTRIIDAVTEQLQRIPYVSSGKDNDTRTALSNKLADVAPGDLSDVVFSVSGSEANELAVQIAREKQDASKVLTRWCSYHGSTYGAGALTGDPDTRNAVETHAATTGSVRFLPPKGDNAPFDADSPADLAKKAADHVEFVIRNEGPDSVAALLIEPVAGSSGAYTAPPGYFERLREICDDYDVLLIADEVITGFGRCGKMFGMQTEDVTPDMITFAKGVTSSYAPLGGVIMRPEVGETARSGTSIGQTFAGHPAACAAGLAAIEEYQDGLIENVQELAPVLEAQLEELASHREEISKVRGRGFHWSIVVENPETGEPYKNSWVDGEDIENPVDDVAEAAKDRGLLVGMGRPDYQLIVCPPLCIDEAQIHDAVETLDSAFSAVFD
ncbi:aspartate aminotransferase family protein [Haloarcula sp. JP-L23]|uniref:aminotransferase family protein n=1 Tax=Haloarcula sp. JP-L23 TaxID=2716717 RepID=UPI00140F145C|nr:aspartate aminotransferase family protein [Haloarcula sp. JP-L23]